MSCRIPYDKIKDLFYKSLQFDYDKYRYFKNSAERIMSMPIPDEAKAHALWYMGLLYNDALKVDPNIKAEGLPLKISDIVFEKLSDPNTNYTELIKELDTTVFGKEELPEEKPKEVTLKSKFADVLTRLKKADTSSISSLFSEYKDLLDENSRTLTPENKLNALNNFLKMLSYKADSSIKSSIQAEIESLKQDLVPAETPSSSGLIDIGKIPGLGKDMYIIRQKDGTLIQAVYHDGTYYKYTSSFTGDNYSALEEYNYTSDDYITPIYTTLENKGEVSNFGDQFRIRQNFVDAGAIIYNRKGGQTLGSKLKPGASLLDQIKVIADRRRVAINKERLARLNEMGIPVKYEHSLRQNQIKWLAANPGKAAVTFLHPVSGFQVTLSNNDDSDFDYVVTLDNLGFVFSDGTVRKIDWDNEADIALFKESAKIQKWANPGSAPGYFTPTDLDIYNIKQAVEKVKEFKQEVMELLGDDEFMEIPKELVSKYFNISNVFIRWDFVSKDPAKSSYLPTQTLESFKNELLPTSSVVRARVGTVDLGRVVPDSIREEDIIGIVKKTDSGYTFESSLPGTTIPVDENDNPISWEEVFIKNGLNKDALLKGINAPQMKSYKYFYLVKKAANWGVRAMQKAAPITNKTEIVDFLVSLSAAKDFKPAFSPENKDLLVKLIQEFNNRGWGFNTQGGLAANIEYLRTWNNETVFGIKFRALPGYEFEDEFNKKDLKIEFSFDYNDIALQTKVLFKAFGIKLSDYNSVESRIELGKIIAQKLNDNKEALSPEVTTAINKLVTMHYQAINNIKSAVETIKEKHAEDIANDKPRYLDKKDTLNYILFSEKDGSGYKLRSAYSHENPLLNYKVFEKNSAEGTEKKLVISVNKPSVITDESLKSVPTTPAGTPNPVIVPTPAPGASKIKGIKTKRSMKMLVSSLEDIKRLSDADFAREIDDIKRMLGSSTSIEEGDLSEEDATGVVLGFYEDHMIKLDNTIKAAGVAYHEAFHAVFRSGLLSSERDNYLKITEDILGGVKLDAGSNKYIDVNGKKVYFDKFRLERRFHGVADEIIKNLIYEEYLADGFRDYKLNKKQPKNKAISLLYKLLEKLMNLFTSEKYQNLSKIEGLYKRIDNGEFADVKGDFYAAPRAYELAFVPTRIDRDGNVDTKQIDNEVNDQLKDRILYELFKRAGEITKNSDVSFNKVYDEVTSELIKYFRVENLINDSNKAKEQAIKDKYDPMFKSMRFIMGAAHRLEVMEHFILQNDSNDPELDNINFADTPESYAFSLTTFEEFRDQVKKDFESVGVIQEKEEKKEEEQDVDDADVSEDELNNEEESEAGERFEDNGILAFKPYDGSREFQKLIRFIKYNYTDNNLGVSYEKMINSRNVINCIRKITSNVGFEEILPSIIDHIAILKNNIDAFYESNLEQELGYIPADMLNTIDQYHTLQATIDTIKNMAGLDENLNPTIAIGEPFLKMFHKVFYYAKKDVKSISIKTDYDQNVDEKVASDIKEERGVSPYLNLFRVDNLILQNDVGVVIDNLRSSINIGLNNMTDETFEKIKKEFGLFSYRLPKTIDEFTYAVNTIYKLTSLSGFNIPRNVIEFSVANEVYENLKKEADESFVADIIHNNWEFYTKRQVLPIAEFMAAFKAVLNNIDSDTRDSQTRVLLKLYKKVAPFQIKYEPALSGTMVKNQDGKPISQFVPYVPSIQILNEIKSKGLEATINKYYEGIQKWMYDNPWLLSTLQNFEYDPNNKSAANIEANTTKLFLDTLEISIAGGLNQNFRGRKIQSTAKSLGEKGYVLSVLGLFANRTIRVGDYGQRIVTFDRPITQLEATSTQLNITSLYQDYNGPEGENRIVKNFMHVINQEYNRIGREWEERNDPKQRFENYNSRTQDNGVVITDDETLRAYNFNYLNDFFERNETTQELRANIIASAKNGVSFEEAIVGMKNTLRTELLAYGEDTFEDFQDYLLSIDIKLDDLPSSLTDSEGYFKPTLITSYNEETKVRNEKRTVDNRYKFLNSFMYNYWFNSIFINQVFDGDIAVGIKSFVQYFKRQKSAVAAGNNFRNITKLESEDYTTTAVLKEFFGYLNNDPKVPISLEDGENTDKVSLADGQAWTTIDRRIKKFDKDGLLTPELMDLLKALRYRPLTDSEIEILNSNDLFLNSDKPVIASPLYYDKDSEHFIQRTDVSHIASEDRLTVKALYDQLDAIDFSNQEADYDAEELYKNTIKEIHSYFTPKKGREFLHHLLNSMEYHRVDVVFDESVSKRATASPLVINTTAIENNLADGHPQMIRGEDVQNSFEDGYINLAYSRRTVPNDLVYEQVKTNNIKTTATDAIQKKLLLPAQLDPKKYPAIANDINQIKNKQNEIAKSRQQLLERLFETNNPSTLIAKLIQSGLLKQGASTNLLKYYSLNDDGNNAYNLNLPILGKTPLFYYFSLFNNNLFGPKIAGKKFYHVSGLGYKVVVDENDNVIPRRELDKNPAKYANYATRYPTVKEEDGKIVVEVIIPRELVDKPEDLAFFEKLYSEFLAARIPTEDKRSLVSAKVVDYIDASYGNSIIVPAQVHKWAGSDLDIDALYADVNDYYRNSMGDYIKYGDYSLYTTKYSLSLADAKLLEYLHFMANDPAFEQLIDLDKQRLKLDQGYRQTSIVNGAKIFGGKIAEFFNRSEKEIGQLLEKENFRDIVKGRGVTVSIADTAKGSKPMKAKGLDALAELTKADIVQLDKKTGKTLKLIERLISVINVLNQYNLPATAKELETYTTKYGNPVTPVLQNEILQHKKNILSNNDVYEKFIKNSSADAIINQYKIDRDLVENISDFKSINKSNGFSFQTVSRVRALNNGAKNMLGANASMNKGASLLASSNIKLSDNFTFSFIHNDKKLNTNTPADDSVQRVGGAIGMSADDAKNQVGGPLRLSIINAAVMNAMYLYGYPEQFARLIHSVNLISDSIKDYNLNNDPSYSRPGVVRYSFNTYMANKISGQITKYEKELTKLGLIKLSESRKDAYEIDPNAFTIKFKDVTNKLENNAPSSFNITVLDKKGKALSDELASVVLLGFYGKMLQVGNAISFKFSKVTDVYKQIRPSFDSLSKIQDAISFIKDNDMFIKSQDIFKVYPSLETLAGKGIDYMIDRSKLVLLDQTNLFKAVTKIFAGDKNITEEQVVTELKSILGFSALGSYVRERVKTVNVENPSGEDIFVMALQDALTKDYWINNGIENDFAYLKEMFPNNEFLKALTLKPVRFDGKGNSKVITSVIGNKLTPESQERLINDFYQLLHSSDDTVYNMAVRLAIHGIIKDGGVARSGSFLKIIAPELFEKLSDELNTIQSTFYRIDTDKKLKASTYISSLDKAFSDIYRTKTNSQKAMQAILTKLLSTVTKDADSNEQLRMSFWQGNNDRPRGKFGDISPELMISIFDTIIPKNAKYVYKLDSKNRPIPNKELRLNPTANGSKTRYELWRADEKGELFFDLNNISKEFKAETVRILRAQGIYTTRTGEYGFPLYQINNYEGGQLFMLQEIDGKPFNAEFFNNLFEAYKNNEEFEYLLRGMSAKYVIVNRQDVDRITPNALSNSVATELRNDIIGEKSTTGLKLKKLLNLPETAKVVDGAPHSLRVNDLNSVKYLIENKNFVSGNTKIEVTSQYSRYSTISSQKGVVYKDGKKLDQQGLLEFANKMGFANYHVMYKDAEMNKWLNPVKTKNELWVVTAFSEPIVKNKVSDITKGAETSVKPNTVNKPISVASNKPRVEEFSGYWTREQVAAQPDKVFLFGDNTNDRLNTKYIPSSTQAVIRGLPNAIGIDTKRDRGTRQDVYGDGGIGYGKVLISEGSYFNNGDFDEFKEQVDKAIQKAKDSGKTIVIPADGIGTGKAMLKEKAPKLFEYLQQELNKLKGNQQNLTAKDKEESQDDNPFCT